MSESNIEKYNKSLTPAERKEHASKAGVASGKARRENKPMKDTLLALLSMPLKPGRSVDIETIANFARLKGKNITVQEAILLAQIKEALSGDTKAAEYIRDTSGNKFKETVEVNGSLNTQSDKLDKILEQLYDDE